MQCIIPGANLKVLGKILIALSKVGDELYFSAKTDTLYLMSVNTTKTVCAKFHLLNGLFSSYDMCEDELNFKLHMKLLLPLFRGPLEKKLDYMKLDYQPGSDTMLLKMKYNCDDIIMIHKLRMMENEKLTIGLEPDYGCNTISNSSSFFSQFLSVFNLNDEEVILITTKDKLIARNYCVGSRTHPKLLRSQIILNSLEFNTYSIKKNTSNNFAQKPFRTAVQFADGINANISLNFDDGGQPLVILIKNPTLEAHFIIATQNEDNSCLPDVLPENNHENNIVIEGVNCSINSSKIQNSTENVNDNNTLEKIRMLFGKCYENTLYGHMESEIVVQNSDVE